MSLGDPRSQLLRFRSTTYISTSRYTPPSTARVTARASVEHAPSASSPNSRRDSTSSTDYVPATPTPASRLSLASATLEALSDVPDSYVVDALDQSQHLHTSLSRPAEGTSHEFPIASMPPSGIVSAPTPASTGRLRNIKQLKHSQHAPSKIGEHSKRRTAVRSDDFDIPLSSPGPDARTNRAGKGGSATKAAKAVPKTKTSTSRKRGTATKTRPKKSNKSASVAGTTQKRRSTRLTQSAPVYQDESGSDEDTIGDGVVDYDEDAVMSPNRSTRSNRVDERGLIPDDMPSLDHNQAGLPLHESYEDFEEKVTDIANISATNVSGAESGRQKATIVVSSDDEVSEPESDEEEDDELAQSVSKVSHRGTGNLALSNQVNKSEDETKLTALGEQDGHTRKKLQRPWQARQALADISINQQTHHTPRRSATSPVTKSGSVMKQLSKMLPNRVVDTSDLITTLTPPQPEHDPRDIRNVEVEDDAEGTEATSTELNELPSAVSTLITTPGILLCTQKHEIAQGRNTMAKSPLPLPDLPPRKPLSHPQSASKSSPRPTSILSNTARPDRDSKATAILSPPKFLPRAETFSMAWGKPQAIAPSSAPRERARPKTPESHASSTEPKLAPKLNGILPPITVPTRAETFSMAFGKTQAVAPSKATRSEVEVRPSTGADLGSSLFADNDVDRSANLPSGKRSIETKFYTGSGELAPNPKRVRLARKQVGFDDTPQYHEPELENTTELLKGQLTASHNCLAGLVAQLPTIIARVMNSATPSRRPHGTTTKSGADRGQALPHKPAATNGDRGPSPLKAKESKIRPMKKYLRRAPADDDGDDSSSDGSSESDSNDETTLVEESDWADGMAEHQRALHSALQRPVKAVMLSLGQQEEAAMQAIIRYGNVGARLRKQVHEKLAEEAEQFEARAEDLVNAAQLALHAATRSIAEMQSAKTIQHPRGKEGKGKDVSGTISSLIEAMG